MNYEYEDVDNMSSDDLVNYEMMEELEGRTNKESLTKIKGTNIYLNSVNVLVGRQRTGKTYTMTKEIIKISRNSKETHLIIYINKSGDADDETFYKCAQLIEKPLIYVSYKEAPKLINGDWDKVAIRHFL